MKRFVRSGVVALVVCLSISCASTNNIKQTDSRPRFHEEAEASVVLQYNSWDYIFMTHPDYRENGFQHQLKREDLGAAFTRLDVKHDLAVVIVGWTYDDTQLGQLVNDWKGVLSTYGFQRVVCVRANGSPNVDGSIVVDDSQLNIAKQTATAKL